MKKIVVFAGSNSKKSINKELAIYASSLLNNKEIIILDLNDFVTPLYGIDEEMANGIPEQAINFYKEIEVADGIILSLAEHNGTYSTAFKNIFDWISRIEKNLWRNTPMLLMATSPGARGAIGVLNVAKKRFPYMGGNIVSEFSLPMFHDNFKEQQIVDVALLESLKENISEFEKSIN